MAKKEYRVTVKEIWHSTCTIEADSEDEARELVEGGEGCYSGSSEFNHKELVIKIELEK